MRAHVLRKLAGRKQAANGCAHGEQVHATALLPQVPTWQWQTVVVAVGNHPVRGVNNQRVVERLDEFHIAKLYKMLA